MPLLFALLTLAGAASAQERWDFYRTDERQAARNCPFGPIEAGGYFCIEIGCDTGDGIGFLIRLTPRESQARLEGLWTVDYRQAGELVLEAVPGEAGVFRAPYLPRRDGVLVAGLKRGNVATFTIINRPIRANRPFGLNGSSDAIDRAFAACPLEAPAPLVVAEPAPAPDPTPESEPPAATPSEPEEVATAPGAEPEAAPEAPPEPSVAQVGVSDPAFETLTEIRALCRERGGAMVEVQHGFARPRDLNGDGLEDMEVDFGEAECVNVPYLYCDIPVCPTRIYLGQPDGSYLLAYEGDYETATTETVVTLSMKDESCTERRCARRFVWREGRLVPFE
ncbi:hypothetical protein [Oceanicola granulosus]|nr:hypothetical protein [Oceanicola granulosus]